MAGAVDHKAQTKQFHQERFGTFPSEDAERDHDSILEGPIDPSDPIFGSRLSAHDLPKTKCAASNAAATFESVPAVSVVWLRV